jgi:hypothetical protein
VRAFRDDEGSAFPAVQRLAASFLAASFSAFRASVNCACASASHLIRWRSSTLCAFRKAAISASIERIGDGGDDTHSAIAARTVESVDEKYPFQKRRPRETVGRR